MGAIPPTGTKHEILDLLIKEELSAQQLAEALHVSPAAIRQHLETLEALGLVSRRKIITQPSRPTYLYRLSAVGTRVFPKRYDLLLGLLVEVLLERDGDAAVARTIEAAARRLAERARHQVERGDRRRRWHALIEWLEQEFGWKADTAIDGATATITIHQCPFHDVSQGHPAVCGVFFTTLIHTLYADVPVDHRAVPGGPACCTLRVETRREGRSEPRDEGR